MRGQRRQLPSAPEVQLSKDFFQMRFHRLGANAELVGDLFIRHPLHGPEGNLVLPGSQGLPQL